MRGGGGGLLTPAVPAPTGAPPAHVAADLLSQAEHGPDSQVVLLALPGVDLGAVQMEVARQCDALPRAETARKALAHSCVVQARRARAPARGRPRPWPRRRAAPTTAAHAGRRAAPTHAPPPTPARRRAR